MLDQGRRHGGSRSMKRAYLPLSAVCAAVALSALSAPVEGDADERGNFEPAVPSRTSDKTFGSSWGKEPLGPAKATLRISTELKNKPVFKARPAWGRGLKITGNGVRLTILHSPTVKVRHQLPTDEAALAREFAWHVRKMCPSADVTVAVYDVAKSPTVDQNQVAVFFGNPSLAKALFGVDCAASPVGTSFLRRKGNWFLVAGEKYGRSHALTYLLEAMGCRYLWPSEGRHGKIVPVADELYLPDITDWTFTPAMKLRRIRNRIPKKAPFVKEMEEKSRVWLGIGADELYDRWRTARADEEPRNRDFWAWHGVGDEDSLPGQYLQGHAFGDYWERFHLSHPEFFALQPNGSRDQGAQLGSMKNRATLCLSNRGLIEQTAKDLCDRFRSEPGVHALSISLPDGGPTRQCMCESCRRLDPKCGWAPDGYVSLTDRVMWFNNEVAKLVDREFPEKKLCFQSYGPYSADPLCVAPTSKLVVFDVSGDYTSKLETPLSKIAKWTNFGVEAFWRPNVLLAFRSVAPQNYARRIFTDLELGKANNCVGVDLDCYLDRWAQFGFPYYMLAKAMLNPDALSFDDLADDYFGQAFGPAAEPMKRYWTLLETAFDEATRDTVRREKRGFYRYQRHLRFEPLEACFEEARRLAKGDELLVRRIAFFERALPFACLEKRIVEAFDRDDLASAEKAVTEYYQLFKDQSLTDLPSLTPQALMRLYNAPCANWLEWSQKERTNVVFDEAHYNAFYRNLK